MPMDNPLNSRAMLTGVHPVLMARDVPTSIAFYGRLGFILVFQDDPDQPRYAVVSRGEVELHLQWHDASQLERPGDRPTYRFAVDDVDRLFGEFVATGAIPPSGGGGLYGRPIVTPWGTQEFHLRDPAGNGLQFFNSRSAQLSAEGGSRDDGSHFL